VDVFCELSELQDSFRELLEAPSRGGAAALAVALPALDASLHLVGDWVSVAMGFALNPRLRVLLIRDALFFQSNKLLCVLANFG
jgi:hypothetical protein